MADAATLLAPAPDSQPAVGRNFNAAAGLAFSVALPAGRRLASARLVLAAADASDRKDIEYLTVVADSGPMAGKTEAPWQWASADWGETRALCGVQLDASPPAAGALNPPRKTGARLRLFSRGNWLPLAPLDTLPTGLEQRVPAQCASRLVAEMLIEGDAADKRTGVLIPGALTGRRIGVRFTRQPCHVSVAVGDDPPFFSPDGPLPAAGLAVDGLARALNRYLTDHPEASVVPLRIASANAQPLRIAAFEAPLEALPGPVAPPTPQPEPPDRPRPRERQLLPTAAGTTRLARLCAPGHAAAQRFAPLAKGVCLSSLSLHLRNPGGDAQGELSLHLDKHGSPAEPPILRWPLSLAAADGSEARWALSRLPALQALPDQPWWLVCRIAQGSLLWYADGDRPAGADSACHCRTGGPWLPLDSPAPGPWLQVRAGVLDPEP